MKAASNFTNSSIYVGTFGKYSSGSIAGQWLNISDYESKTEFLQACKELHSDEADAEFMFQDWENIPSAMICESWIDEKVFEFAAKIKELSDTEAAAFSVYLDNIGMYEYNSKDVEEIFEDFLEAYNGEFESEEDFAYYIVDECYSDIPEFAKRYFDYSAFARDLFIADYNFFDGFVFRR